MRDYPHRPDETFLRTQLAEVTRRIERYEPVVAEKLAAGRLHLFHTLTETAFDRARLAWALEEPVTVVGAALRQATGRIDDALERGFTPDSNNVDRWLQIAVIGGDSAAALQLATRIEAGIEGVEKRGEVVTWYLAGLMALLRGHNEAAGEAAAALRQWLDSPGASPRTVTGYGSTDALLAATASSDQTAFDAAAADRSGVMAEAFGASVELRRHPDGLLDAISAPVARLAALRGLTVPADDPYLAADLLAAVPWSAEAG